MAMHPNPSGAAPQNYSERRLVSIPAWIPDLLDSCDDYRQPPAGEFRLTVSHTAPDGTVTTTDYGRLDVSGSDGAAMLGMDYDWGDEEIRSEMLAVPKQPTVYLRMLLSARLVPDEETGETHRMTVSPPHVPDVPVLDTTRACESCEEPIVGSPAPDCLIPDAHVHHMEPPC